MSLENATNENKSSINSGMDGNASSIAPKARKAYTITKHREKWTEEEHQKFLEAIKLYSRGWRQIEEHVGTKTAVQIRSHAQKFFTKVNREGNDPNENAVEIPPPRPKRKSVHPYPHKNVSPSPIKPASTSYQPESPPPLNLNATDTQSACSTSLVSTLDSQLSPTSCATNNTLLVPEATSPMDLNSSEEGSCSEEDTNSDSQPITITLFGKTFVAANNFNSSPKASTSTSASTIVPDDSNSSVATAMDAGSPWWASYPIVPFPYMPMCNGIHVDLHREDGVREEEGSKRSKQQKGFVPYKRCLAQSDISSPVAMDDEEDQRIRVCL